VRCEDFKTLEFVKTNKQTTTAASEQKVPQDVYCKLQELRTSLYQRYSTQHEEGRQQYRSLMLLREQKFVAFAVANNGVYLWKSMMHDRYRWIKAKAEKVKGFGDIGVVDDLELDR